MNNLIKQILNIINMNIESSQLTIKFYSDNAIVFLIYETEIPICINIKEKYAYVDTETMDHHLTGSMLDELNQIVKIIDNNMDTILECLN